MNIYPPLLSGAVCQFPTEDIRSFRTIVNGLEDGSRIVLQDPNSTAMRWKLAYSGLSSGELSSLQTFFETVEGRLQSFTFFDPGGNLLVWSEDFTQGSWQKSTFLQLQPGAADPLGTNRATTLTNSGAGDLALVQTVAVPGNYVCCWSVFARSEAATNIELTRGSLSKAAVLSGTWERFFLSALTSDGSATSDFGVTIPAGASIQLFGLQVEAQPAPSAYTQTLDIGGVYPSTRFDSDSLLFAADAPNSYSCQVSLYSRVGL